MRLSDYLIMSDVDGTLLPHDRPIPQRNIAALERFTAKGGRFAIATGRSKEATAQFVKTLPVNAPCVVCNGGCLYDYKKEETLMEIFLPESAKKDFARIFGDWPQVPAFVVSQTDYYHVTGKVSESGEGITTEIKGRYVEAALEELTAPWYKGLFVVLPQYMPDFQAYLARNTFPGVRFVRTTDTYIEMLPKNSNKAAGLMRLVELGRFRHGQLAAIGDFYNDLEMIEYAAIGAATAEAPEDIKAKADFITGPCEDGAVADLVEYLESISE